jgi:hypothetical protein
VPFVGTIIGVENPVNHKKWRELAGDYAATEFEMEIGRQPSDELNGRVSLGMV